MKRGIMLSFVLAVLLLSGCAQPRSAALAILDPWARPGLSGGNSAIYFSIENPTTSDDTLMSAESSAAEKTELHKSSMDADGNMQMQPQENVLVPAGVQVQFEPGGLHVMLVNLHQDLNVGDEVPLTLHFENFGSVSVQAVVKEP